MYLVHPYKKVTILRKMREGKEVRTVPWRSLSLGVITPVTLQRIPQRLSQLGSRSVNDGYSYTAKLLACSGRLQENNIEITF